MTIDFWMPNIDLYPFPIKIGFYNDYILLVDNVLQFFQSGFMFTIFHVLYFLANPFRLTQMSNDTATSDSFYVVYDRSKRCYIVLEWFQNYTTNFLPLRCHQAMCNEVLWFCISQFHPNF